MPSHNEYPGYVKLPGKDSYKDSIRLDFNFQLSGNSEGTRLNSFNLRLFTLPTAKEAGKRLKPEIGVRLTAEQWLDLIDAMREEIELADKYRRKMEDLNEEGDE